MGMAALSLALLDKLAISGVRTYCNGRRFPLAVPFPNLCLHLFTRVCSSNETKNQSYHLVSMIHVFI